MTGRLGIGIITYNRAKVLEGTVDAVRRMTARSDVDLVIADDGSTDDTRDVLARMDAAMISGQNMGIAWNKNRALFVLSRLLDCETVILLEDDVRPQHFGWEAPWVAAAQRWGHANWAAPWMTQYFTEGAGTPDSPYESTAITAQCASFSRDSLIYGGYFDTRFRGFGHEHVEHTRRLVRVGYGGTDERVDGQERVRYKLIESPLTVIRAGSFSNEEEVERNVRIAHRAMAETTYRGAWADEDEMRQLRAEVERMQATVRNGFALNRPGAHPAAPHPPDPHPLGAEASEPVQPVSLLQRLLRSVGLGR